MGWEVPNDLRARGLRISLIQPKWQGWLDAFPGSQWPCGHHPYGFSAFLWSGSQQTFTEHLLSARPVQSATDTHPGRQLLRSRHLNSQVKVEPRIKICDWVQQKW